MERLPSAVAVLRLMTKGLPIEVFDKDSSGRRRTFSNIAGFCAADPCSSGSCASQVHEHAGAPHAFGLLRAAGGHTAVTQPKD